ncbi:hypothetical protein CDL60_21165 [Roseateles noduli]|nr:hypothetical protein CDL60_21165 [Roseateles noduli]
MAGVVTGVLVGVAGVVSTGDGTARFWIVLDMAPSLADVARRRHQEAEPARHAGARTSSGSEGSLSDCDAVKAFGQANPRMLMRSDESFPHSRVEGVTSTALAFPFGGSDCMQLHESYRNERIASDANGPQQFQACIDRFRIRQTALEMAVLLKQEIG